jgi:hypothetical protein
MRGVLGNSLFYEGNDLDGAESTSPPGNNELPRTPRIVLTSSGLPQRNRAFRLGLPRCDTTSRNALFLCGSPDDVNTMRGVLGNSLFYEGNDLENNELPRTPRIVLTSSGLPQRNRAFRLGLPRCDTHIGAIRVETPCFFVGARMTSILCGAFSATHYFMKVTRIVLTSSGLPQRNRAFRLGLPRCDTILQFCRFAGGVDIIRSTKTITPANLQNCNIVSHRGNPSRNALFIRAPTKKQGVSTRIAPM